MWRKWEGVNWRNTLGFWGARVIYPKWQNLEWLQRVSTNIAFKIVCRGHCMSMQKTKTAILHWNQIVSNTFLNKGLIFTDCYLFKHAFWMDSIASTRIFCNFWVGLAANLIWYGIFCNYQNPLQLTEAYPTTVGWLFSYRGPLPRSISFEHWSGQTGGIWPVQILLLSSFSWRHGAGNDAQFIWWGLLVAEHAIGFDR